MANITHAVIYLLKTLKAAEHFTLGLQPIVCQVTLAITITQNAMLCWVSIKHPTADN